MLKNKHTLITALSALALSGCAQTGITHQPLTVSTPEQVAAAAEAPANWRPFSAASPWNTKIAPGAATAPGSAELVADMARHNAIYINMPEWTVATYYIDSATTPQRRAFPRYPGHYGAGFAPGTPIPTPDFATPSGPAGGTEYLVMIDPQVGKAWEMHQPAFNHEDGNWITTFGSVVDLSGDGVPAPWMTAAAADTATARPSGIPLVAGLIRLDEIKAGRIDHALAFAYPGPRTDRFTPPAGNAVAARPDRTANFAGLPLGARIQLDPQYDIDNTLLSPAGKVIARALQEYGAILVDEAGATTLYAEGSPAQIDAWRGVLSPNELQILFTPEMMAEKFRVIEMQEPQPGRPRSVH